MTVTAMRQQPIRSTIPARLDRLRWSPFHTRLVLGLGTAWVLDGLSVTIASSVTGKLTASNTLHLTTTEAASIGTVYLIGEVVGALVFGRLSDQLGRRRLFVWTLAIYLVGTGLTALTPRGSDWVIYLFATRFIAGTGIGGEYSAINSAIDEMMPARYRGRTDIWINGTYWLGAILGTFASFLLLNSLRPGRGLAGGVLVRPGSRGPDHLCAAQPAGKPAVAHRAWPGSRGRGADAAHRGNRDAGRAAPRTGPGKCRHRRHTRETVRVPDVAARGVPPVPAAGDPRRDADDHPVVPVQRDLLHLCPRAHQVLRRQQQRGPAVRSRVRGRQPGWPAAAGPPVRQRGAEEDDLRHVPAVRGLVGLQCLAVRCGGTRGGGPDVHLDRHLLLRLGQARAPAT